MKLFMVLAFPLALAMSNTIPMIPSFENSLMVDVEENHIRVNKEINFDKELQLRNLTSFRALLIKAKLFDTLNDTTKSFTVYAPSNKAIENAPSGLLDNVTRLPEVLEYHVHKGSFTTKQITENMILKTLVGGQCKIRFNIYAGVIYGSCQQIGVIRDQTYDNGILNVMNGVMVPPDANFLGEISKPSTQFGTLLKYVNKAEMGRFLQGPLSMTFLAPNDAAFKKLSADVIDKLNNDDTFLSNVLKYHLLINVYCSSGFENGQEIATYNGANVKVQVSGGKVLINNSTVIQADVIAYNGVLQFIDNVLLPPQFS